jgi:sigma-E factor negative regulatory protein RseA
MNNINNNPETDPPDDACALSISVLMDGALAGPEIDAALAAAAQPEGQERWRVYHLIGDSLRAADLAAPHDTALLAGVRAAMRQPAVTPEPELPPLMSRHQAANDGVFRWKLAAGFASLVAVAAIGWNVWGWSSAPAGRQLAQAQSEQPPQVVASALQTVNAASAAASGERMALKSDGDKPQILRDPQLDRLLAAHRRMTAFGGGTPTFLRNATFEEPQR